jgi:GNAT superfamily N-acetyltransferase
VAFYVHNLVVRPRWSGHGMGRELLAWAERDAAGRGRDLLRLDCVASNATLCAFYARAGFTERGDVEAYGFTLRRWEKAVADPAPHQR